jgi:hypothetical protein
MKIEFVIFAVTLIGVAVFHRQTMYVALAGLAAVLISKYMLVPEFSLYHHMFGGGLSHIPGGEWRTLLNLLGLLFGFAILAKHFEESNVPEAIPSILPQGWIGGFTLLAAVCFLSSFLDNIAAAMIGGTIAMVVFEKKVHVGFLAAIVAASNAGGSGSVVGDTTTTLMWIDGVAPVDVLHAFGGAIPALLFFGFFAARQQDGYHPIQKQTGDTKPIDWGKLVVVFLILVCAILTNWLLDFPAAGVWIAIFVGALFKKTPWGEMRNAWRGTVFLMSLVTIASLMPVEELPPASMWTAFALGFISAVFDNIPLTKLCLVQGGYDWGICLLGRIRRFDDLVRLISRGRALQYVPGDKKHN